jgi:dolichyl-diphosphooligosaccharide--protein glycosyltransferase
MFRNFLKLREFLYFSDQKILNNKILASLLILLLLSVFLNFNVRNNEKDIWYENKDIFYSEGIPLVQSGDPGYYLNQAVYLKKDIPLYIYNNKLNFPSISTNKIKPSLLSLLISFLANDSSLEEITKAGNKLVIISSIFTTLGTFFLFFVIGRPFEGTIASAGAGMSTLYFYRSNIGYIDTDILNLFFMYLLFSFIYLASKSQPWSKTILFLLIAGLVGKSLYLWYPKPELILMSFFSLVFFTIINTKNWKKILFNSFFYILLTGPTIYLDSLNIILNNPYLSGYLSANVQSTDLVNSSSLNFNNIFEYIAEQQKYSLLGLFKVEESIYLGLFCFIGLALWAISYPINFIGFAPLVMFFLLSMILGKRAIFYSMPFIWFGFGYFINFIVFKITTFRDLTINKYYIYFFTSLFSISIAVMSTNILNKKVESPFVTKNYVKAMIKMNDIVSDKKNSVIAAQWTYGYQSLLYNDIPVLIHPGMPTSPRHYFMSRAFTSNDLDESKKILNYIAAGNVERIKDKEIDNFSSLSKDLYQASPFDKDIYFMLTNQQRRWMNSEGATAYWDIEKNKPHYFKSKTAYEVFNIMEINCEDLDTKTFTTKCAGDEGSIDMSIPVNLALGTWDKMPLLKRIVQVEDGEIVINEEYKNNDAQFVFQIIKNLENNTSNLYLMHEAVFRSAYNKLLHLNQNDGFELVYDNYPYVKIYKVN